MEEVDVYFGGGGAAFDRCLRISITIITMWQQKKMTIC